jgi:predicted membrane-bound dolichyl-phosphate-mannose-protein mannosyltransferase
VALWFLLLDMLGGRPFFTPAALGAALLLGATSPAEVSVTLPLVAAYTMLHLAAFAILGILIEWAAERLERAPAMWIVGVLIFVMLEALFIGIVGSLGHWVLGTLGYWAVAVGNVLAIAAMAMRVRARHPGLQRELAGVPAGSGAG